MSKQTAWLENFTGLTLDPSGTQKPERRQEIEAQSKALLALEQGYADRRERQAELLALVRGKLGKVKNEVQATLSQKITEGPFKGKSFLDIEGGQRTEIDVDELSGGKGAGLPKEIRTALGRSGNRVAELGLELSSATFEVDGKPEPLFTAAEIQEEYWTPLKLERIFPEGFIPHTYSETQQMLDATTALYLQMVEEKRLAGELTPERDLLGDALDIGSDLLGVVTSGLGGFSGPEVELAKDILQTGGEVLAATKELHEQVKNSDYGAAASGALDIAGKLTGAVLGGLGVDKGVIAAVGGGFATGSQAVLMGQSLMKFKSGDAKLSDALGLMGGVVAQALSTAGAQVGGDAGEALKIAARAAPAAFKAAKLAPNVADMVRADDFKGIVNGLADIAKDVLASLPGLDNVAVDLDKVVDLSAAGVNMTLQMAINLKRGDYLAAFNDVIGDIGSNLGSLLEQVGVPGDVGKEVVGIYKASASATKALQCMATNPPKVVDAVSALTGGLKEALGGTSDPMLAQIGGSLDLAVKQLVQGKQVVALYLKGADDPACYDQALKLVHDDLTAGLADWDQLFAAPSGDDDDDGVDASPEDGGGKPTAAEDLARLLEQAKKGEKPDPAALQQAMATMKARQKDEQDQADADDAKLMLAEAELDIKAMSEAEQAGAEASNIDRLIADLLRDRMLLKLASQIAEGGAAFLAKFVPALGAVSAGIKLAASLVALAQRARQLDRWIASQSDLEAAQSSLSSAAANFVKNQGQQLAHYSAQAFFAAAQLGGEIAKLAGPAAAVGQAISSVSSALGSGEEILLKLKNKADVEKAWKVTVLALRNPGNRRLGLEARELNPSLAKFSIAWGAVVLKDPLARHAMKACGLTEASLKDANTDTRKVVKYLEYFYEDDPSLYREDKEDAPDWMPAELELTLLSWSGLRRLADTKGGIVVNQAGAVEGLLGQYADIEIALATSSSTLDQARLVFSIGRRLFLGLDEGRQGGDKPSLPPTADLEKAMEAHAASLADRKTALLELQSALQGCEPALKAPKEDGKGKEAPGLKGVRSALLRLGSQAARSAKAAEIDAGGLQTARLELRAQVDEMQRAKAEAPQPAKEEATA